MTETNEFDINNAHDAGFRAYFSEKEVAMSVIRCTRGTGQLYSQFQLPAL